MEQDLRDFVVSFLSELVAIDTSQPENYPAAMELVKRTCAANGIPCSDAWVSILAGDPVMLRQRQNLVIGSTFPSRPRVIFYTHIDVVPAQKESQFQPRIEGGKLFGRGAADMKSGIAALVAAFSILCDAHIAHDAIGLITTDEETDQKSQLAHLFDWELRGMHGGVEGAVVFDLDTDRQGVQVGALGTLQFEIIVKGKAGHSGAPHLHVNAISEARKVMNRLAELEQEIRSRNSVFRAGADYGFPYLKPTLSLVKANGGLAMNIIPDSFVLAYDRRLLPEETLEEAEHEIRQELSGIDVECEMVVTGKFEPYGLIDPRDFQRAEGLLKIVREVTGQGKLFAVAGSGDLSEVVRRYHLPLFGTGVIRQENDIHGANEFVYLSDVENLTRIIAEFLKTFCRSESSPSR